MRTRPIKTGGFVRLSDRVRAFRCHRGVRIDALSHSQTVGNGGCAGYIYARTRRQVAKVLPNYAFGIETGGRIRDRMERINAFIQGGMDE